MEFPTFSIANTSPFMVFSSFVSEKEWKEELQSSNSRCYPLWASVNPSCNTSHYSVVNNQYEQVKDHWDHLNDAKWMIEVVPLVYFQPRMNVKPPSITQTQECLIWHPPKDIATNLLCENLYILVSGVWLWFRAESTTLKNSTRKILAKCQEQSATIFGLTAVLSSKQKPGNLFVVG